MLQIRWTLLYKLPACVIALSNYGQRVDFFVDNLKVAGKFGSPRHGVGCRASTSTPSLLRECHYCSIYILPWNLVTGAVVAVLLYCFIIKHNRSAHGETDNTAIMSAGVGRISLLSPVCVWYMHSSQNYWAKNFTVPLFLDYVTF